MSGNKLQKLKTAIKEHRPDKVKKLVQNSFPSNDISEAAKFAVQYGSFAAIEAMPSQWFLGNDESYLLHIAAKKNYEAICTFLLGKQLNPNVQDQQLDTPLHIACRGRNREIIRLLIQSGAQPDTHNKSGVSPKDIVNCYKDADEFLTMFERDKNLQTLSEKLDKTIQLVGNKDQHMDAILTKLDKVATKMGDQDNYIVLGPAQHTPSPAQIEEDHIYSWIPCDFLQGNPDRRMEQEEIMHIQSKLSFLVDNLTDDEKIKDIADRMYSKYALSHEQLDFLQKPGIVKDKVRFLVRKVIVADGKLCRYLEFKEALKDVKEKGLALQLERVEHAEGESTKL